MPGDKIGYSDRNTKTASSKHLTTSKHVFKHFLLSHYDYIRFYISKRVLGNIHIW